ncbi:MAG TPA: pseudouridine synthase, partial [Paludibacter sp.]|nr:pseudouridine synthase [Paludibacter sp.]
KPWENREGGRPAFGGPKKPWENRDNKPSYGERKPWEDRNNKPSYGERKPWERQQEDGEKTYGRVNHNSEERQGTDKLSFRKPGNNPKGEYIETRFDNKKDGTTFRRPIRKSDDYNPNSKYSNKKQLEFRKNNVDMTKPVRLNKFLANAGICSRREADEYIQAGVISVNGEIVTEMGVKVLPTDKIMFHDQTVRSERKVYILLNKPKDCVTTSEDTHDRLTVLDLVKNACSERIYPVGRLDRNTTGVLLLTNDGDLASKLTHPKYDKKKIYHVTLEKPLEKEDFDTIMTGVALDDTTIAADALEFVKEGDLKQLGIEIHSGQNRVVRRIFEKLGYKIIRLDRVFFAGLTKKNVPRGKYRFLTEREISMLKMGAHE